MLSFIKMLIIWMASGSFTSIVRITGLLPGVTFLQPGLQNFFASHLLYHLEQRDIVMLEFVDPDHGRALGHPFEIVVGLILHIILISARLVISIIL